MLFAGFSVSNGELTLFGVVAAGVLGNLVGSWIAYAVGYYGRLDLLEKNKLIHISPKHLKWADDWFERYGDRDRLLLADAADRPHLHLAARPGWRRCRSGASPPAPCSARSPGCWRWRWSAKRSATTGKSGATTSATSTTWSLAAIVAGVVYLIVKRRRGGGTRRGRASAGRDPSRPARAALERGGRGAAPDPARGRAGHRPGPGGAAAGLQLRPHRPRPLAGRLGLGGDRPGAAQELRGGAAHRRRGGAADRPAAGDRARSCASFDGRRALLLGLSFLPAAVVGYTLERPIERRLGGPRATAYGLLAGAAAMLARRHPPAAARARRRDPGRRARARHRPGGGAGAGRLPQRRHPRRRPLARASRATRRTCSRARSRCRSSSAPPPSRAPASPAAAPPRSCAARSAVGVAASFASTLASQRLIGLVERDRALWPTRLPGRTWPPRVLVKAAVSDGR